MNNRKSWSAHINIPVGAKYLRSLVRKRQHIRGIPRLVYMTRKLLLPSSNNLRLVDTPDGIPVTLNLNDYAQVMQFYFPYSPELCALLQDLLLPGDVCVDCGANTGLLSIVMAEAVGPEGRVIAVDPNPDNIRLIQNTLQSCSIENVIPVQVGIAGNDGTAYFAIPQGAMSDSGDIQPDRTDGLAVRLVTVNTLMNETAPDNTVSFIKYDIEGAEAELIESLQVRLDRGERPVILVEFHPNKMVLWGKTAESIRATLWELGYDERRVEADNGHYRLRNDREALKDRANLLFLHPSSLNTRSRIKAHWSEA